MCRDRKTGHLSKPKLFNVKLCLMRHTDHKNGTLSEARRPRLFSIYKRITVVSSALSALMIFHLSSILKIEAMTCDEFTQYITLALISRKSLMQHNNEMLIVVKMIPNSSQLNGLDLSEILSRQLLYLHVWISSTSDKFHEIRMDNTRP